MLFLTLFLAVPGRVMAAGQKTVYVLTSVSLSTGQTTTLSYNKNGLLSKASIPSGSWGVPNKQLKASYDKNGFLKKAILSDYNRKFTHTFSYQSGKPAKHTVITKYDSGTKETSVMTYKFKGKTFTSTVKDAKTGEKEATVTGKTNSKNRLLSLSVKNTGEPAEKVKFKYDTKGFLKSAAYDTYTITYTNTVKSGRLVKMTEDKSTVYSFKYKKVTVPASYVPKVKAQQNYIISNLTQQWYSFDHPIW